MRRWLALFILIAFVLPAGLSAEEENWRKRASDAAPVAKSDIEQEIIFGREVAARLIAHYRYYDNEELMRYVNLVGKTLAQNSYRPEIEFHFAVLQSDDINAYAAPGGYIFVTKAALAQMKDESELAGVLAHEIMHVSEKHIVKELNIHATDDSAVAGFARLIGGSSEAARTAFAQAVDKAMDMLFSTGYRRDDERSADRNGILLTAVTGYDPNGLIRYLDRISGLKGRHTDVLDKTHPPYAERTALLREVVAQEELTGGATNQARFETEMTSFK
jgi:predicted Zn-dependent protease